MNPYLKYNNGGKVKIGDKEYDIKSKEYRDLYNTGTIYPVDREGVITSYAPEVEVVGEAPAWLREKREKEKNPTAFYNRKAWEDYYIRMNALKHL